MSPPQLSVDLPIPSRLTNDSLPHTLLRVFHSVVSLARHPFSPSPFPLKSPGNCIHPGYRAIVPIITATRARVINATGYHGLSDARTCALRGFPLNAALPFFVPQRCSSIPQFSSVLYIISRSVARVISC